MDKIQNELQELQSSFDLQEVLKRFLKYLIEGSAVAVVAYYIPNRKLEIEAIVILAFTAAAVFALLDMYAPSIGSSARQGTGFGIGANLVGFPMGR